LPDDGDFRCFLYGIGVFCRIDAWDAEKRACHYANEISTARSSNHCCCSLKAFRCALSVPCATHHEKRPQHRPQNADDSLLVAHEHIAPSEEIKQVAPIIPLGVPSFDDNFVIHHSMKLRARSKEERKPFISSAFAAQNLRQIAAGLGDDEPRDHGQPDYHVDLPRRSWANAGSHVSGHSSRLNQFDIRKVRAVMFSVTPHLYGCGIFLSTRPRPAHGLEASDSTTRHCRASGNQLRAPYNDGPIPCSSILLDNQPELS
jgi:hypothetical protein